MQSRPLPRGTAAGTGTTAQGKPDLSGSKVGA